MVEERVDVALISDPYKADPASSAWHVSAGQRKAAIYVANTGVTVANVISDPEFVSARLNGVQVYSCYASPNRPIEDFQDLLCRLEDSIRTVQQGTPVLVTGDLNARSAAWGDWVDNRRGEELGLLIESLGLVIANTGSTPTFTRGAGSIVDVTLSCDSLAASITDWRVLESLFNNSDHHYIRFSLTHGRDLARATSATTAAPRAWNTAGGVANDSFLAGLVLAEWLEQGGPRTGKTLSAGPPHCGRESQPPATLPFPPVGRPTRGARVFRVRQVVASENGAESYNQRPIHARDRGIGLPLSKFLQKSNIDLKLAVQIANDTKIELQELR
ncbi:hypothetical protein QTP88_018495 [Uroleucon formosanum]